MWDGFRGDGRLLVVDDDLAVARLTSMVLQQLGFTVDVVAGGNDALRALGASEYRLALVDLTMPDLDGPALLRCARSRAHHMPFVLTSGCPREEVEQRLREQDFAGYLQKPYRMEHLVSLLRQLLGGLEVAPSPPSLGGVELATSACREPENALLRHR